MTDHAYAEAAKKNLFDCINSLDPTSPLITYNPSIDFSRNRKLPFHRVIETLLEMNGGTLQNELLKAFDFTAETPYKSALCQQRDKIRPEAFSFLFSSFTKTLESLDVLKLFHGFRILDCDGSDVNIPYNPSDTETFFRFGDKKGFNQLHLNALYDPLNGFFPDCVLDPSRKSHERAAFITMIDRFQSDIPTVFLADRGYESYQVFAHIILSGQKFLIRLKEPSSNGILSTYDFPSGEFDNLTIKTILTHRQTKEVLANKDLYTIIPDASKCDFFPPDNPFFPLSLRIICVQVSDDKFEYFASNLSRNEMPFHLIKELYHWRWNQETSFRHLKYTVDLLHFHARKRAFVEQEIWAHLTLYNFCGAITCHTAVSRQSKAWRKYDQKINFATAACICKAYLQRRDSEMCPCRLISKFLIPIKPNRSAPRNLKAQSARMFIYRAA